MLLNNVHAEPSGRLLATRLWEMTDDPGMKEMLAFLIARDTMHQNRYEFFVHSDGEVPKDARWTSGSSVDSHGKPGVREAEPMGEVPELAPAEARPELHGKAIPAEGGILRKAKDAVTP